MNCQKTGLIESPLKVLFQGQKGQILAFFTYVSMLFSSAEVLPNFLAPCSFIGVMSMLS